ncbi:MAG: hypothetical protein IKZ03_07080 [Clostridia bacterium]|nr:hypothetical protein [Clostridia bacterium]
MKILLFAIIGAVFGLGCYILGIIVGRLQAEDDFIKKRKEMGLDEEPDDWDKLFKG